MLTPGHQTLALARPMRPGHWSHENMQVTVRTEARSHSALGSEKQSAFQLFSLNINEPSRACLRLPKTMFVTAGGINAIK